MSAGGYVIALIMFLVAALWISGPLFRREPAQKNEDILQQKQVERLAAYYERVLTNIRDLDEDHATGKMQTTAYEAEREEWIQRGIQILKALDGLGAKTFTAGSIADEAQVDEALDDEIEAAIAAYRSKAHANEPE